MASHSIPASRRAARAVSPSWSAAFGVSLAAAALVTLGDVTIAQTTPFADVRAAAVAAMGGRDVATIEFSGSGWDACLGQAWKISDGWARWEVQEYRRVIDYGAGTSLQTARRRAAMDPEEIGGCGAQPGAAFANQQTGIVSNANWPDQLPIWLTPHGFLALAGQGTPVVERRRGGTTVTLPVTRAGVRYTLNGYYDRNALLERIETWIDDPVYGDMKVEARFADYRDFGGVRFPASLIYSQGGFTTLNLAVHGVVANTDASAAPSPRAASGPPPAAARAGGPPAAPAEPPYYEIADGIFVFSGAYQGVAVEFQDFSVVIDGMQSDARVRDVIDLTRKAIPGKPIRYAVNTHSHFDHAAGLRLLAAEGAVVLTHDTNRKFFERALNTPRTLTAAPTPARPVKVQGVRDRHVIRDAAGQSLELHALRGGLHAADMLIAYLPRARAVVESDLLQPWINPVFGGGRSGPHPYLVYLFDELERLELGYEQFVPVHRPPAPPAMKKADLLAAVGRSTAQLSSPNATGITTGHVHLIVADVAAHARIWALLGGEEKRAGDLQVFAFPGAYVALTSGTPVAPSSETAINHVGFAVRDYGDYKAKLKAIGATFVFDSEKDGQMIADLPGGVRIELLADPQQPVPIAFHHAHLSAVDGVALRDWYVRMFGAEPGERRNLPSAVVPGGRVDFLPVRGPAPRPSRGAAIDHIGFEAQDLEALARRLQGLGVSVDRRATTSATPTFRSAFVTDPAGASIELTQGLDEVR
jgi:glyoxylase-like metal-dependent hydrolase (beta-lactamase superfamily II)/catechol 2,3-dioxygenase-like lactoylglutathione lyase family enzyme